MARFVYSFVWLLRFVWRSRNARSDMECCRFFDCGYDGNQSLCASAFEKGSEEGSAAVCWKEIKEKERAREDLAPFLGFLMECFILLEFEIIHRKW